MKKSIDIDSTPPLSPRAETAYQNAFDRVLADDYQAAHTTFAVAGTFLGEDYDGSGQDRLIFTMQQARIAHGIGFTDIACAVHESEPDYLLHTYAALQKSILLTTPYISGLEPSYIIPGLSRESSRKGVRTRHGLTLAGLGLATLVGQINRHVVTQEDSIDARHQIGDAEAFVCTGEGHNIVTDIIVTESALACGAPGEARQQLLLDSPDQQSQLRQLTRQILLRLIEQAT